MSAAQRLLKVLPRSVPFVDYREVEWEQVRRAQYWMYQRFRYEYPGPIQDLHQRLIVVPGKKHGGQLLTGHKLKVSNPEALISQSRDSFNNLVYKVDVPQVDSTVDFEVWSSVERVIEAASYPVISSEKVKQFLEPTTLTTPNAALRHAASFLSQCTDNPWQLAESINDWVWKTMRYTGGITNVSTTAAEALHLGQGLCQDYSHIMLTICRLVGLPARYVSGHLLGEGGSHAWLEVFLPAHNGTDRIAVAYDPTNHCQAGGNHITVAVGRDYSDVAPTSGYYTAPYSGKLITSKQAGLIRVEYKDGEVISVDERDLTPADETRRIA